MIVMNYNRIEMGESTTFISEQSKQQNHVVLGRINDHPEYGMIYDLFISTADRGRGKGKLLTIEAINLAKERNLKGVVTEVKIHNTAALNVFEGLGFTIIGTLNQDGEDYYRLSLSFSD